MDQTEYFESIDSQMEGHESTDSETEGHESTDSEMEEHESSTSEMEEDKTYFKSIHTELCLIEKRKYWPKVVEDDLHLRKMELRFIERFCRCSVTPVYTLRRVWESDGKEPLAARLRGLVECREWLPLSLELVEKTELSKIQVKLWCESWSQNFLTGDKMLLYLDSVFKNLKDFLSCKKGNNAPLKKQMRALEEKIVFLKNLLKLTANCIASQELRELTTHVHIFACEAADLTFMYWVNGRNERITTQGISLMISDMLQKIELYTRDIRASVYGFLKYKASTSDEVPLFLDALLNNLKDLVSYKADRMKQIKILEKKVVCLQKIWRLSANGIDINAFRKIKTWVHVSAQNAACLTLECWFIARDEDFGKMLYEMLQKIEPSHGILASLFEVIKYQVSTSNEILIFLDDLLQDLLRYQTDNCVPFKKQIQILERMVLFLQNFWRIAENGICINVFQEFKSWVHDFAQNVACLTLECWLIAKDEDSKMIEPSMRNIRASLFGFLKYKASTSDEIPIFLDALLITVENLVICKAEKFKKQIEILKGKIVFMQNLWRLAATGSDINEFKKIKTWVHVFAQNAACLTLECWFVEEDGNFAKTDLMLNEMLQKIEPCMRDIRACLFGSLKYKSSTSNEIPIFLDALLKNIKDLLRYKPDTFVPYKNQNKILERMVVFLRNIWRLAANGMDKKVFQEFKTWVHDFAENTACLTLDCWLIAANEDFGKRHHVCKRDFLLLTQSVAFSFVDLLLENLPNHLKDDFQILREVLIFVLSFIADPPNDGVNDVELTSVINQIDVLLQEGSCLLSPLDDTKEHFSRRKVLLCNFVRGVELVTSKIRRSLHCKIPHYYFPRIIGRGFLDFFIQNLGTLKEKQVTDTKCVPFAKYKIIRIEEELVSLRPFFKYILEFQSKQKELNDTRLQVIHLLHLAEHVTNSCFDSDHPIWYHMANLSDVIDRIMVVKEKFEQMKECNMYKVGDFPHSASSLGIISQHARAPGLNEVVVGFEEEANIIIDNLRWGHKSLDIVSIVGMAGLGKTTLARKVYGTVQCYFHKFAFASVSRNHSTRSLFLDILGQITLIDDDTCYMTEEDLAHRLRQCLSRQTYLIVLDDIWDIRAWNDVKSSFPDDQNGSRVMLTTRFHQVAMEAQIRISPYTLSFLSEEKCWELLQRKVFNNDSPPPDISEVGKLIARNCKGVPLAVVVIAGLLKTKETSVSQWTEISERIGFHLSEGLMDIFELIYEHLPGHLKPCLLYFGGFPEDMMIGTKILMHLWIAEGFVEESERKSLLNVANKYLNDLADRSLIVINGRSSSGGIKTFGIHDLIHDFCRKKAGTENFFFLGHEIAPFYSLKLSVYDHYRVFLKDSVSPSLPYFQRCSNRFDSQSIDGEATVDATPPFPSMRSLLCFNRGNEWIVTQTIVEKFKLVQVLYLENMWLDEHDLKQLTLLVHLRQIVAPINHVVWILETGYVVSVPTSISSLSKLETLILRTMSKCEVLLPETIWTMGSLRNVNISRCKLTLSGENKLDGYPQLGKMERFSSPTLSTGKDLQELLQRLPAVRKLSCRFDKSSDSADTEVERLDFDSSFENNAIESLNLTYIGDRSPYVTIFPSTLKKLKLMGFKLPWTAILDISTLPHLEVLKLLWNSFVGPRWYVEDVEFPRLKFLKMNGLNLVRWNTSPESFPLLEQLFVIGCEHLIEIPSCLGESSTLKKLDVHACNSEAARLAIQIKNELRQLTDELLP